MAYGYTAYVLDAASRDTLLEIFVPRHAEVVAHHITHKFGGSEKDLPPVPQDIKVVGCHQNDKVQALVVEIDGARHQTAGPKDSGPCFLHITLSLDKAGGATPRQSNDLLQRIVAEKGEAALRNLPEPVSIHATPKFIEIVPCAPARSRFSAPKTP